NISTVYNHLKEYDKAIEYGLKSLEIKKKIGDKLGISSSYANLGMVNFNKENYREARKFIDQSLEINIELGNKFGLENDYFLLSQLDSTERDFKNAYNDYKMHVVYRDSLINEEHRKKTMETQLQYEFDKKAAADSVKTVEAKKVLTIQLEHEKTQRFALYGGLTLVVLFAGFMFNRFRITQKQKKIIEVQKLEVEKQKDIIEQAKELVEEKQVEILDSIKYAKTLQEAILPSRKEIEKHLPQSFLVYKPKDIIAGDFYWMHTGNERVFIAAADCTGHGVPGAMVSVVCSNALNRAVKEFGITNPAEILDKTRELVIETFEKSDKEVKDGMDIALCALTKNKDKTFTVEYAGANNSLWYIKEETFFEIKADKQPIGKHIHQKPFTTHAIQLNKGDAFYIFTDGYPDQFGGQRGKKFKYKPLQELIIANSKVEMQLQKERLENTFESWKGNLEQVDDVCIIGVRL
ncbi:MAG: SpoIIE family protein phosphatase, partial [Bacteroidia bacterium]